MTKKKSRIPDFTSREEEAKFWNTHSFAEYWDELEDVNVKVELDKPKEETLVLRVNKGIKDQLANVAKIKGLNVSALARMWLMERLQASHS